MKTQIENLKTELREFIKLSKTVTGLPWKQVKDCVDRKGDQNALIVIFGRHAGLSKKQDERDATFIARSRNISPAMAECLLIAATMIEAMSIEVNVECSDEALNAYAQDSRLAQDTLQQILIIWEASK